MNGPVANKIPNSFGTRILIGYRLQRLHPCADTGVVIRAEELVTVARATLAPAKLAAVAGADNIAITAADARVAVAQLSQYLLLKGTSQRIPSWH